MPVCDIHSDCGVGCTHVLVLLVAIILMMSLLLFVFDFSFIHFKN
jgi:hypothetical protein